MLKLIKKTELDLLIQKVSYLEKENKILKDELFDVTNELLIKKGRRPIPISNNPHPVTKVF